MKNLKLNRSFSSGRRRKGWGILLMVALALTRPALADDTNPVSTFNGTNADLTKLSGMSIEQLMDIKVSILGPSQSVSKTPAAVSVVTQDDIRRSGARNIPEALRLVPGMDVGQMDASQWAVSARGFNDEFANKLLVMQDGRSIYTPLFSGVFWDVQGTMLEDVDHIEVIRGPGATLWGANAVNGVINILTKSAADTQGWLVDGGGGNQDRGFVEARYGGKISDDAYYRIYGTYENHAPSDLPDGSDAHNSWQLARGGFRADWNPGEDNTFTLEGDGYAGWIDQVFDSVGPPPTFNATNLDDMKVTGANVLGHWTHTISDSANLKLRAYYDYTARDAENIFDEQRHTFDLSFQNEFMPINRNKLLWGLGYRLTADREADTPTIAFAPESQAVNLYSGFVQDEIAVVKDRLSVTLGTKLEHNDYTGFEVEPGGRVLWTPWALSESAALASQTFWGSISRAVRTPSRAEESVDLTEGKEVGPGIFAPISLLGTNQFNSEHMLAYEIGYRAAPWDRLSLDITAFFNQYDDLRSQRLVSPGPPVTYVIANDLHGHTYGAEITATWRVVDWWRLQPAYTFLHTKLFANSYAPGLSDSFTVAANEGSSPQNQFSIRSLMDLPHNVTLDTALRYVDRLQFPQSTGPNLTIPGYFELDARVSWRINKNLEVSVVGQNLLHNHHAEFAPTYVDTQNGNVTDIPRSVYGEITWRF